MERKYQLFQHVLINHHGFKFTGTIHDARLDAKGWEYYINSLKYSDMSGWYYQEYISRITLLNVLESITPEMVFDTLMFAGFIFLMAGFCEVFKIQAFTFADQLSRLEAAANLTQKHAVQEYCQEHKSSIK